MDINNLKFDYKTLIIDDNEKIDKQKKEKERLEKVKMDPFMREFLNRKGSTVNS
jgi:predicted nuclease of restriction endonuclease-like (RecB) superfamily